MSNKVLPSHISDQLAFCFKKIKTGMSHRSELSAFDAVHDGDELRVTLYCGSVSSMVKVNIHRVHVRSNTSISVKEHEFRFIKQAKEWLRTEMNTREPGQRGGRIWGKS
ncbi:hypothetical protein JT321_gp50 [Providencia phage Kokobel1]|uniref:Uncharacterized protein n=1 Tax=Providencia phage Kokobel1 TaxID=2783540 RepID=A0A873WWK4_9CAUD|nr:hypothetical protein JT321_gp50 [Providencia phage Kokobel1]QPB11477.1 hypothetical protein [Providencia phage Kokobel1]